MLSHPRNLLPLRKAERLFATVADPEDGLIPPVGEITKED